MTGSGDFSRNACTRPSASVGTDPNARGSSTLVRCRVTSAPPARCVSTSLAGRPGQHVAVEDQHVVGADPVEHVADPAAGAQRRVFGDVLQLQPELGAGAEVVREHLRPVRGGQHHPVHAGRLDPAEQVGRGTARRPWAASAWARSASAAAAGCPGRRPARSRRSRRRPAGRLTSSYCSPPTRTARADGYCCDEYAAMAVSRRGLLGGAARPRRGRDHGRRRRRHRLRGPARPPSSVMVVLSLRGGRTDYRSSCRTGTRGTTRRGRGSRSTGRRCSPGDASFGLHPALARCCRCGPPASGRGPRHRHDRWPTGRTSPRWRRWRTPTGLRERVGWLNRLRRGSHGCLPLQGFSAGDQHHPTSLVGPDGSMSAPAGSATSSSPARRGGRRQKSLQTTLGPREATLGRSMRTTFEAIHDFGPAQATADNRATYPGTGLGRACRRLPGSSAATSASR